MYLRTTIWNEQIVGILCYGDDARRAHVVKVVSGEPDFLDVEVPCRFFEHAPERWAEASKIIVDYICDHWMVLDAILTWCAVGYED